MYSELHCLTNFSFLRGASHPGELVECAKQLGYAALAITDECSVAGAVRAHVKAKEVELKIIIGSEFKLREGLRCVILPMNRAGYGQLCRLISHGRRSAEKGEYDLCCEDFFSDQDMQELLPWKKPRLGKKLSHRPCNPSASLRQPAYLKDCLALWIPAETPSLQEGEWMRDAFPARAWLAVELLTIGTDRRRLERLTALGKTLGLPLVASGDVHMHVRERRALQDTLTAVRLGVPLARAGFNLYSNGERHLRTLHRLQRLYPAQLLEESVKISERCTFSLDELRYEYPEELVPHGETPTTWLRKLTEKGMNERWPEGAPEQIINAVEHELQLIAKLNYEPFFLTVADAVEFARGEKILCQGRGSAANSVVCYCLKITSVDPVEGHHLFERFISAERNEPPDIDVDFEHDRREEVIQHLYGKYGRHRAALAATVITYQPRSALRDVGKALGFDLLQVDRLARTMQWWDRGGPCAQRIREAGFDPNNPLIKRLTALVLELQRFPRHLSQHVGGFVISKGPLAELVPLENASMPQRTVIQWDKDDLEDLGLLKVDVLALGMLSVLRRSFELMRDFRGRELTLATLPQDDARVYDMICAADTVGVFQIESRAQMSMLPRLRPRRYYDLVIEVAIVRPGPIQGDMVHPYLRRRMQVEAVTYPSPEVEKVLKRTLGVPIFQEQVMQLAIVAAGFSAGEADQLRRAMAAWKRKGDLERFEKQLVAGMHERGYADQFAQQIVRQIRGFGEYGFPEAHAASFALLVYVSAWFKCHEPAIFLVAMLNSQPMGFYAPSQLVQDAQRHGVQVRPIDVRRSLWDCVLERREDGEPAVRLGMRLVKGLRQAAAQRIVQARSDSPIADVQRLAELAQLDRRSLSALAAADALSSLAGNRHHAVWAVSGVELPLPLLPQMTLREGIPLLRRPQEGQDIIADYRTAGLTLRRHPLALLRDRLRRKGICCASELKDLPTGAEVKIAGLVIGRQRPGSASGVTFVTLEDETGSINLIVWQAVGEAQRLALLRSQLMEARGKLQHESAVMHVIVTRMIDRSRLLGGLTTRSRDFH